MYSSSNNLEFGMQFKDVLCCVCQVEGTSCSSSVQSMLNDRDQNDERTEAAMMRKMTPVG